MRQHDNKEGPRRCVGCNRTVSQWDRHHIIYTSKRGLPYPQSDWMSILCIPCHAEITSRNTKGRGKDRIQIWQQFLSDNFFVIRAVHSFNERLYGEGHSVNNRAGVRVDSLISGPLSSIEDPDTDDRSRSVTNFKTPIAGNAGHPTGTPGTLCRVGGACLN